MLGEEAFLFRDHQRRGIHQRDVAEDGFLGFRSRALRECAGRERGLAASDGRVMLVEQGIVAFERFFGVPAPAEVMRAAVEEALRA